MSQEIEFELDEETDTFHLFLDGDDQGPVDTDSLRETAGNLHLHFRMFRDVPPEDLPDEESENYGTVQELSDEEVEEELREVEAALDDIED